VPGDSREDSPLQLGPFVVRAAAGEAEAFARATGASAGRMPFTFPVRWLAHPEIRAAAGGLVGETAWVPIHESQSFTYRRGLEADVDYRMRIDMRLEAEPPRLIVRAEIATRAGEACLDMETILRIVMTNEGSVAP
jgi:hypothetical protein